MMFSSGDGDCVFVFRSIRFSNLSIIQPGAFAGASALQKLLVSLKHGFN